MYADFLKGLAELAVGLDVVAKVGSDAPDGMTLPTPYLAGKVEVKLEGVLVGHFVFEDEWVLYEPLEKEGKKNDHIN